MSDIEASPEQVDHLLSPEAIREQAQLILDLTESGEGQFELVNEKFDEVVELVITVVKSKYPDLNIPYHSRWGHFNVGNIDRLKEFNQDISDESIIDQTKAKLDLVMTSVLLDAGAGPDWKYQEDNRYFSRSEGLAVASYHMFKEGYFSSQPESPFQADGPGLLHLTEEQLQKAFQVTVGNPLVGTAGRTSLMHELGRVVENSESYFSGELKRPGNLVDYLQIKFSDKKVPARELLKIMLRALGPIWPGRLTAHGLPLGDIWSHDGLGEGVDSLVPLHKLSQWLTYSLIEPLEECGFEITDLNKMTGLAEYRNGGLLIDSGLLKVKDSEDCEKAHHPDSKLIIEWRALTIVLLDRLAVSIRQELDLDEKSFPLVKVLEGGTWWAGRKLAQEKRKNGDPPLQILSDGTVF